jgi:hypothetical protein
MQSQGQQAAAGTGEAKLDHGHTESLHALFAPSHLLHYTALLPDNDMNIHRRRSIRLKGYDYSHPGAYFVTVCTHDQDRLLENIVDGGNSAWFVWRCCENVL